MLTLASYDIVFQEVPGEVTLALNISGCPNRCPGCHSPHLQQTVGEPLDETLLEGLLGKYGMVVSCVCFMGGDGDPGEVNRLAKIVRERDAADGNEADENALKTAWYSGRNELPESVEPANFDYIKLGGYMQERGGLDAAGTNQRFYRIESKTGGSIEGHGMKTGENREERGMKMVDITDVFTKKQLSSQE